MILYEREVLMSKAVDQVNEILEAYQNPCSGVQLCKMGSTFQSERNALAVS